MYYKILRYARTHMINDFTVINVNMIIAYHIDDDILWTVSWLCHLKGYEEIWQMQLGGLHTEVIGSFTKEAITCSWVVRKSGYSINDQYICKFDFSV